MQLTAIDIEAGHPPHTVERALRTVVAGARRDGPRRTTTASMMRAC